MRRKDREVTDIKDIKNIIDRCDICRIALNNDGYPYILPLNFGVDVENKDELIGRTVMFEVKKAGGRFIWVDIKPLVKKNKKK